MNRLFALIDPLWALDATTPAEVAQVTGVALTLYEDKFGYQRYRGMHPLGTIELGHRPAQNAAHFYFTPSVAMERAGSLAEHYGQLGTLDLNPNIGAEGVSTEVFRRAKDKVEMRWGFTSRSRRVHAVSVGWSPHKPPTFIYLASYDRHDEQLKYTVSSTFARIVPTDPAHPLTLGAFVFEFNRHLGVYASPEGPVFFMDNTRIGGAFGEVTVSAANERFRVAKGRYTFEIPYKPRVGLHTNPYDVEQADIDLFALMERGARDPKWWSAYTRPWVDP